MEAIGFQGLSHEAHLVKADVLFASLGGALLEKCGSDPNEAFGMVPRFRGADGQIFRLTWRQQDVHGLELAAVAASMNPSWEE
jgi:hypothetical protein